MTAEQLIKANLDLIKDDRFQEFYDNECEGLNGSIIRRCHEIFYNSGIDPIIQGEMHNIPRCYWSTGVYKDIYEIPTFVKSIDELAFARSRIKKIVFADYGYCSKIGQSAFEYSDIEEIYLPQSLSIIEYGAFHGCEKLKNIYYQGTKEDWNSIRLAVNYNLDPTWISKDTPAGVIHCTDSDVKILYG